MGKYGYLKMNTDPAATELIASDFKELGHAAKKLANHAIMLGSLGLGTSILKWIAFAAAVYFSLPFSLLSFSSYYSDFPVFYSLILLPHFLWITLFTGVVVRILGATTMNFTSRIELICVECLPELPRILPMIDIKAGVY